MGKFFKDILTEDDNQTWCIARVSVLLGVISFIVLAAVHVWHNATFSPADYGMGLGTLLGGGGVLIGGKAATQKDDINKLN